LFPGVDIPPASHFAHTVNHHRADLHLDCMTLEQAVEQTLPYPLNGYQGKVAKAEAQPARLLFTSPLTFGRPQPTSGLSPLQIGEGVRSILLESNVDQSSPAIELDAVSFAYQPDKPVLQALSLMIPRGQFVALTGDNGAGKTTLARHLIGLLRPTDGCVSVLGENTSGKNIGQLARQVGFVFQNPEVQIFHPTVREEVAFGPRNLGVDQANVDHILERFALLDVADHPPAVLSFSLRRMVALASIAAMNTPVLVLDEPTVGLDAQGTRRVMDWLGQRHQAGDTIVLVTHDMELAAAHAERVLVLHGGRIIADGTPASIFSQTGMMEQAGLESPFSVQYADQLKTPALAADLTPQGTAQVWLEHIR
jgi:energy-coupling factor transport system ATP-binding protein